MWYPRNLFKPLENPGDPGMLKQGSPRTLNARETTKRGDGAAGGPVPAESKGWSREYSLDSRQSS